MIWINVIYSILIALVAIAQDYMSVRFDIKKDIKFYSLILFTFTFSACGLLLLNYNIKLYGLLACAYIIYDIVHLFITFILWPAAFANWVFVRCYKDKILSQSEE